MPTHPYREVRAHFDDAPITVYQAYSPAIADAAVEVGTFVAPFKTRPDGVDQAVLLLDDVPLRVGLQAPSASWQCGRVAWGGTALSGVRGRCCASGDGRIHRARTSHSEVTGVNRAAVLRWCSRLLL